MARIVLSEQNFGAVGLLTTLGQNNDQFRTLFTIVFIASVYGLMAAPTLRSLLYAAGLAAVAALAFAATVARFVPQLVVLVQYFQRGRTRLLTAAELDAHAKELLAAETEPPLADPTLLKEQRDARVRRRKNHSQSTTLH